MDKKVKELNLTLTTAEQQALYFLNRDFTYIPYGYINSEDYIENVEVILPSDEFMMKKSEELELTVEQLKDKYLYESRELGNGLYMADSFYYQSDYCNVDTLYDLGFNVVSYNGDVFIKIYGYGYSFIDEHFIPLFKKLGWIKFY